MKENDVIIITLKGENTKKYFLNKIAPNFGVRFKEIPKESLEIEVEVVAKKEMDDPQRKILDFMKKHKGQYFDLRELAYYTKYTKSKLKTILKSLRKRDLIKTIKFRNGFTYFYIPKD